MPEDEVIKLRKIFAERLQAVMSENKIKQNELADMLHVSESTVGKWLLMKALPRMGIVEKLASIFGKQKSYFLEEQTSDTYYINPETAKFAQEAYTNPQYKALFDATRGMKPESIKEILKFIEYQKAKENGEVK